MRASLLDALTFPLRGSGPAVIAGGAVLLQVVNLMGGMPVAGAAAALGTLGYLALYYLEVVDVTVSGGEEPPPWPGVSDLLDDIVAPLVRLAGLALIAFGPLLAVRLLEPPGWSSAPVTAALGLWGLSYFPMAVLASEVVGSPVAGLPHRVIPAIARTLPGYLMVVGATLAVVVLAAVLAMLLLQIPWLGFLLLSVAGLYLFLFHGRLVGLTHRRWQLRLGWDEQVPS